MTIVILIDHEMYTRGENTTEFYDLGTTIVDMVRVFKEMIHVATCCN